MRRVSLPYRLLLTLFATLGILGCEDDVTGPDGVEEPFSMFGIINPRLNQQTLLVSPVEDLLVDYPRSIDAVLTSTDLTSGERRVWHDSAATNTAGRVDHIFWSDFRPDFGSRYRIDVERSDGAASSVEVDVPVQVIFEQEDTGTRHFSVSIRGESFRLVRVEAVYTVRLAQHWDRTDLSRNDSPCKNPQKSYAFTYSGSELETGNGVRVNIDLDLHYFTMASYYHHDTGIVFLKKFPFSNGLALMGMELRVLIGNESWSPPGGEFDPNVLVQPGTLRNVQNGLGFVGAGYNQDFALYPSQQSLDDTWFFDYMMRPPTDCFDYCSCGLG